jgi:hypothetical protein
MIDLLGCNHASGYRALKNIQHLLPPPGLHKKVYLYLRWTIQVKALCTKFHYTSTSCGPPFPIPVSKASSSASRLLGIWKVAVVKIRSLLMSVRIYRMPCLHHTLVSFADTDAQAQEADQFMHDPFLVERSPTLVD